MIISLIYKATRKVYFVSINLINKFRCHIIFLGNNVSYKSFQTQGIPFISIAIGGECSIGNHLVMNNGVVGNPIGCFQPCTFFVDKGAKLIIGDNLGISQAALICHIGITIGNNVKIGGGACIYDTDFHSLDSKLRANSDTDFLNKVKSPVVIGDNVFIGTQSLILKGINIGENSIIGAGSVVTKDVPANEIWAGNPARFIREL